VEKSMEKTSLFLAKKAVIMKLSKIGFDTAICPKCGKIFEKAEGRTLCKDCQE
jgi:predicted amidophosphoribosyltransferase